MKVAPLPKRVMVILNLESLQQIRKTPNLKVVILILFITTTTRALLAHANTQSTAKIMKVHLTENVALHSHSLLTVTRERRTETKRKNPVLARTPCHSRVLLIAANLETQDRTRRVKKIKEAKPTHIGLRPQGKTTVTTLSFTPAQVPTKSTRHNRSRISRISRHRVCEKPPALQAKRANPTPCSFTTKQKTVHPLRERKKRLQSHTRTGVRRTCLTRATHYPEPRAVASIRSPESSLPKGRSGERKERHVPQS
jgi:hypothetical protein